MPTYSHNGKQKQVDKSKEFMECDSCWVNAKHPAMLCSGCHHNRAAIAKLQATIAAQEGHLKNYQKRIAKNRLDKTANL